ncbi:hypothetical protein SETIT_7G068400v2 [Setaria italica]|uniref:Uncharacterized protein n=1 Tax=Setaria italica TaxID=4555 RepID=A0A368RUK9_SETIT|nr:hypothetical protein SETIT_7G068400v2 [Setaria italica]
MVDSADDDFDMSESVPAIKEILDQEEDEHELSIIEKTPSSTPRKRRDKKMKEPLDVRFVRRSRRLKKDLQGFRDEASAAAPAPTPLEAVPSPAPHLSVENVQGIATGFLQIQPMVVSAEALNKLNGDNVPSVL